MDLSFENMPLSHPCSFDATTSEQQLFEVVSRQEVGIIYGDRANFKTEAQCSLVWGLG